MTRIESITYNSTEGSTIHMADGTHITEHALDLLAQASRKYGERAHSAAAFLEAAWLAAHPVPKGATIPAHTPFLMRDLNENFHTSQGYDSPIKVDGRGKTEYRTFTPIPEPEPDPEPWEVSRFCYADGNFYERFQDSGGAYWKRPGEQLLHRRKDLKLLNPKPVTIEGETE